MKFKNLGLVLLLVFPLLGLFGNYPGQTQTIPRGYCEVSPHGKLNGECLGLRGEICMVAYDPLHCPLGQLPKSQTQFCRRPVDGIRSCRP